MFDDSELPRPPFLTKLPNVPACYYEPYEFNAVVGPALA